jgi:NAD(P)-dependent dehydrogenase (short-subunit alcohol dehydrogenase family)
MTSTTKTWFITGAARGIGYQIMLAALSAGHNVVATARDARTIHGAAAMPAGGQLLNLDLDVTDPAQAAAAAQRAAAHFGAIDVLVNNAGYGQLGVFEENTQAEVQQQFATNVFGLFNVTRAVLPFMRRQKSGRIFNLSSIAGVRGSQGASMYCASKFAVEGFSESLSKEVAEFGIKVTIVQPGYFRTDFMDPRSIRAGTLSIGDYAGQSARLAAGFAAHNHRQAGDPALLAQVLLQLAASETPPLRFAAGSDAVEIVSTKLDALRAELEAWRALSSTTDGKF